MPIMELKKPNTTGLMEDLTNIKIISISLKATQFHSTEENLMNEKNV